MNQLLELLKVSNVRHAYLLADKLMNAAALRYYLLAEGINTYLFGGSLRTRELDPIFTYKLHQIFVSILTYLLNTLRPY